MHFWTVGKTMGHYKDEARKKMEEVRKSHDMTPVSMFETLGMPPDVISLVDEIDIQHRAIVDYLIEVTRLDREKTPNMTGMVYGYYVAQMLEDANTVVGVMGEALIRLAQLPDLEDPTETKFEEIIRDV